MADEITALMEKIEAKKKEGPRLHPLQRTCSIEGEDESKIFDLVKAKLVTTEATNAYFLMELLKLGAREVTKKK